jgi:hydroxymethylpyrimidine/phosphomethylpyrimidine kinase
MRERRPVCAVSIAMSDSGGGAGIQADLLTFAAHGVYGATVLVAATAQNTLGVQSVEALSTAFLRDQTDAVFSDLRPGAVKIGALFETSRIRTVVKALKRWRAKNTVLDPVMAATTGRRLLSTAAVSVLRKELLPLCDLVTPNLPEAQVLSGIRIRNEGDRRLAAGLIADLGAKAVLVKGGHGRGSEIRDLLFDGQAFTTFTAPRIATRATHGTGCTLSSAIAANLALGRGLEEAIERSIAYLRAVLKHGLFPGGGYGVPDHFASDLGRMRKHLLT